MQLKVRRLLLRHRRVDYPCAWPYIPQELYVWDSAWLKLLSSKYYP